MPYLTSCLNHIFFNGLRENSKNLYQMIPLLERYPLLRNRISHIPLGEFPTPVIHLSRFGRELGSEHLYLKHDGISAYSYGGNKVRKLEFLLADALQKKAKEVLTFGFAGSNHALATAVYARKVGLKCTSVLLAQPNAGYVRRNLLFTLVCGANIHHYRSEKAACIPTVLRLFGHILRHGRMPYMIQPGGSSPLGTLGYVNASFELTEQVVKGIMPEPDCVFVPLGTMGTAVGLLIGLRAAGFRSRVIPVRVVDEKFGNKAKFIKLHEKTLALIHALDTSFPQVKISDDDIDIIHDFFGERYALFTEQGMAAIDNIAKFEGIKLDGTYTGKTMAALIHRAGSHELRNKVILFWNTYNASDFSNEIEGVDYHQMRRSFHRYFEEDVQPLDRNHECLLRNKHL